MLHRKKQAWAKAGAWLLQWWGFILKWIFSDWRKKDVMRIKFHSRDGSDTDGSHRHQILALRSFFSYFSKQFFVYFLIFFVFFMFFNALWQLYSASFQSKQTRGHPEWSAWLFSNFSTWGHLVSQWLGSPTATNTSGLGNLTKGHPE